MHIRRYTARDRDSCLAVLRTNAAEHFVPDDEALMGSFLDELPGPYYVVLADDGRVIACGGMALEDDPALATLCWGIVAADHQRKGVGSALLKHRLAEFLPEHPHVKRIQVNTSQKVQGFFEHHGFTAIEVRPDGYGVGLDHVRMVFVI